MNIKNISKTLVLGSLLAVASASCESDIDKVYVLPSDDINLSGATGNIILSPDNAQSLVLSVYWTGDGRLSLSDSNLQAPVNVAVEAIEFAADEAFTQSYTIDVVKGERSRQFLGNELSSILSILNYEPNELTPLYIRLRSTLASNVAPTYSNTIKTMVQTYRIYLTTAKVLDSGKNETGRMLYSPNEDGIYTGFLGVGAWYNWWLLENNNFCWGNLGEDGKSFYASSESSAWNFWYPGESGCYFTTVNTVEGWWSALFVREIVLSGDIAGQMEYNQKTNQWSMDVDLPAGNYNVAISGHGTLYNKETTADGPGIDQTVGFTGSATGMAFGSQAQTVSVELPGGATTLILDLNDLSAITFATGEAAQEEEVSEYLYFSGLVDWNGFDDYLTLYDEATLSYGGAHYIDSEWGYRVYPGQEWLPAYKATDESIPTEGRLVLAESDGNVPAPEKGLYVMDFNMKSLTYYVTKINAVTFTGLNDDWSETPMVQSTDNPEVFTGEFVKRQETPWGVKVLINNDWGMFFGGGSGKLKLGHSDATGGFDGDNDLTIGETYILTVDLGKQTYSYSKK